MFLTSLNIACHLYTHTNRYDSFFFKLDNCYYVLMGELMCTKTSAYVSHVFQFSIFKRGWGVAGNRETKSLTHDFLIFCQTVLNTEGTESKQNDDPRWTKLLQKLSIHNDTWLEGDTNLCKNVLFFFFKKTCEDMIDLGGGYCALRFALLLPSSALKLLLFPF